MQSKNFTLLTGTILGLLSVIMAAYIDHSWVSRLSDHTLKSVLTGVRYHQLYSVMICILGLAIPLQQSHGLKRWLTYSACIFIVGVILFAFSIYASVILDNTGILYLTPIGGILLMCGWVCLGCAALSSS